MNSGRKDDEISYSISVQPLIPRKRRVALHLSEKGGSGSCPGGKEGKGKGQCGLLYYVRPLLLRRRSKKESQGKREIRIPPCKNSLLRINGGNGPSRKNKTHHLYAGVPFFPERGGRPKYFFSSEGGVLPRWPWKGTIHNNNGREIFPLGGEGKSRGRVASHTIRVYY